MTPYKCCKGLSNADPLNAQFLKQWCAVLRQTDGLEQAILDAEQEPEPDRATRYRLMFLYQAAGGTDQAEALADSFPNPDQAQTQVAEPVGRP